MIFHSRLFLISSWKFTLFVEQQVQQLVCIFSNMKHFVIHFSGPSAIPYDVNL